MYSNLFKFIKFHFNKLFDITYIINITIKSLIMKIIKNYKFSNLVEFNNNF